MCYVFGWAPAWGTASKAGLCHRVGPAFFVIIRKPKHISKLLSQQLAGGRGQLKEVSYCLEATSH